MGNESIQIQVSMEEVRQAVQSVMDALSTVLVQCRPADQLITVEDRCIQRWPMATARNRHRVRDVFVAIHRQELGHPPLKLTGYRNGTIVVEREHLGMLDQAIDRVMSDVERGRDMPLFNRRPR